MSQFSTNHIVNPGSLLDHLAFVSILVGTWMNKTTAQTNKGTPGNAEPFEFAIGDSVLVLSRDGTIIGLQ